MGGTFSLPHALASLVVSVIAAILIGVAAGAIGVTAWHFTKDDALQACISLMLPYFAYLPAEHFGVSGVLAVVTAGLFVNRYTPRVLTPSARQRATGFWVTIVFVANALIFVLVGLQFHSIVASLSQYSLSTLIWYGAAVSLTVIIVRLAWTFGQGLLPYTNEPEHVGGKAEWSHVAVLAWSGMRGGISLAAALAIPFTTALGPFPGRNLVIFLTFCVLLATLVGQGGTLPLLIRWLRITDDGADEREERIALSRTSRAALKRIDELEKKGDVPQALIDWLRLRFQTRSREFSSLDAKAKEAADTTAIYRKLACDLLDVQRGELIKLRDEGKIDNTVFRRIQRLLDLETLELEVLSSAGHTTDIDEDG